MTDLTGQKFGRLEVKEFMGKTKRGESLWGCLCDCGSMRKVLGYSLESGNTKSCGCLRTDNTKIANTKHGHNRRGLTSKTYTKWIRIQQRCYNPKASHYEYYGGRGIKVCDRWLGENGFEHFLADMGVCPDGMSLDRIDNDGNYEPGNCRWATHKTQMNNTRHNDWIKYDGKEKTLTQWAEYLGMAKQTLRGRLYKYHWSIEKSLTYPIRGQK